MTGREANAKEPTAIWQEQGGAATEDREDAQRKTQTGKQRRGGENEGRIGGNIAPLLSGFVPTKFLRSQDCLLILDLQSPNSHCHQLSAHLFSRSSDRRLILDIQLYV